MSIEKIINEAWEIRDQVNQDSDKTLKRKELHWVDLGKSFQIRLYLLKLPNALAKEAAKPQGNRQ